MRHRFLMAFATIWLLGLTAAILGSHGVSIDGLLRAERDAGPIEAQAADTKISALSATTSYECSAEFPAAFSSANEKWTACNLGGHTRLTKSANYTIVEADRAKVIAATSGSFTLTYTAAATLGSGWWHYVDNEGTGLVTLDGNASETINGQTTFLVNADETYLIYTDGSNLFAIRSHGFDKGRRTTYAFYDFMQEPASTGSADTCIEVNATGSTSTQAIDSTNRPGVVRGTTSTSATGGASLKCAEQTSIALGNGLWVFEAAVNITTLSTGTERYQLIVGFHDVIGTATQTDAAAILYDEGGVSTGSAASANWQCLTASNNTRTYTTSGTAVTAAAWHTIRVEVNAGGTSVAFFVDGTSICTAHTTNIPTGTARALGYGITFKKSVGTTARTLDTDYVTAQNVFTTAR